MTRIVIEAERSTARYWSDLWRYRELFYFLAWRDVLVRYKQTVIGVAWAILRPFLTMLVFSAIFSRLAKLPTEVGAPYPVMVFVGMLPWQFFATAASEAAGSLVGNANLISKIYFPRMIVPASSVMTSLFDFAMNLLIMAGLMVYYDFYPGWTVVALPMFTLLALAAALGGGLWLSALNVKYRDFRYITPFIVQFGLYVSPVGFSSRVVPDRWQTLYCMNPMVGIIDGFRWALLGGRIEKILPGLISSAVLSVALLGSGLWFFRRTERSFADII